nr:proline-rich protein 36-like [Aegilops tauschii subsp. strangulata]
MTSSPMVAATVGASGPVRPPAQVLPELLDALAALMGVEGHALATPDVHIAALVGSVVALASSVARHLALPSPSPSTDLLVSEDTAPIADPAVRRPRTATALPHPPLDAVAPEPAAMPLLLPCERLPLLLSPPTAPCPRPSALSRAPVGHALAAPDVHVAALVGSVVALAGSVARHLALPSPSPSTDLLASEDTAPIADPAVRRPRTATALPRPPLDAVAPEPAAMPLPLPSERLPLLLSPPPRRARALARPCGRAPRSRSSPPVAGRAQCPAVLAVSGFSPCSRSCYAVFGRRSCLPVPPPPASPFTASARNSQRRPGRPAPWSPAPRSAQIGCAPRASARSGCAR